MFSEKRGAMLQGVMLIALFSCAAFYIADTEICKNLSFSPMIIGILLGMLYANSLRMHLPETWVPGIQFSSKKLLRLGIILYGFRLTFQDIASVGVAGIVIDAIVVTVTIIGGYYLGKLLRMDREIALLTSVGSGICGAAAVLGAEATLRTKPYKTAVAVATVVIFGTLSMFLYPILYRAGILNLTPEQMGIYGGSTLHEVAHAVGAGNAMGEEISKVTVIVKMIRVMMLVPVLLVLGWWVAARGVKVPASEATAAAEGKIAVPWFAFLFLAVIGVNSFLEWIFPGFGASQINQVITYIDTFLLTMAMVALGAETSIDKFKKAGAKPFLLAFMIYIWLVCGGYLIVKYVSPLLLG
ncbi:MAG: YeiH family putative sulfate export transporter [Bacteroides sp.]|nr:YeiH family putative sulfate export transporter [Bacteroides sp.]